MAELHTVITCYLDNPLSLVVALMAPLVVSSVDSQCTKLTSVELPTRCTVFSEILLFQSDDVFLAIYFQYNMKQYHEVKSFHIFLYIYTKGKAALSGGLILRLS